MKKRIKAIVFPLLIVLCYLPVAAQSTLVGTISEDGNPLPYVNVVLKGTTLGTATDEEGQFSFTELKPGKYTLLASYLGYVPYKTTISIKQGETKSVTITLQASAESLNETVVTGTLKPVSRLESPVPVEVYSPAFLKKNPTASIFDALQNVNGVRPQINCNVCNTGDIHINGLEGPYTLVLIDGMPIVSGLGTVYGLMGIPNSLIEQIEIVKGPASSLYGSEAVGGLINIITKHAPTAPQFFADGFATTWGEYNLDVGSKITVGKKADMLLGINYFNYSNPIDNNGDNFTDLTLQDRISVFQKWNIKRKDSRLFTLAGRFFYEDRWGGEMQWTPEFRGGDSIYGESIYTRRWEILGKYELPIEEKMMLSVSFNDHHQNSVYGNTPYLADQRIGFAQLTWDKSAGNHDLLFGSAVRYNYYDDNTTATTNYDAIWIPSLFAQDEIALGQKHSVLTGIRYDYDKRHGNIFTPRVAYKWKPSDNDIFRVNAGTGFRVVNLFTEEHAALTGARDVVIAEELKPERSVNVNLNYLKKVYSHNGTFIGIDASVFYTHFSNAIIPDYETDPTKIIYDNLDGKSVSQGISANLEVAFPNSLRLLAGATLQDVSQTENGITKRQILTERFTGTWSASYTFRKLNLTVDYTGNLYGPMRLPLLGKSDTRPEYSPFWSIQNIQFTYKGLKNFELYGGVKNLLDWTPSDETEDIIAGADAPFEDGFDPSYVYAPNQGIRGFFGLRYTVF